MHIRYLVLFAAAAMLPQAAISQTLQQVPDGVLLDGNLVSGATLLTTYEHTTPAASAGQDQARNRQTVERFFALPIGPERAGLFAPDGVKQIPAMGVQWAGAEAQLRNNAQNQGRYPGWRWYDVVVWNTEDPTVFWVEARGETAPGMEPAYANHYVGQFIVRDGMIVLFREFATPVRVDP